MRTALGVAIVALTVSPVSAAQSAERLPRQRLVERSGEICANAVEAGRPHLRRLRHAQTRSAAIRHGRRAIKTLRPYVRRLGKLRAAAERDRYRTFVDELRASLNSLEASLDALAAGRDALALRRAKAADEHAARAKRAARRYPLRRACTKLAS